MEMSQKSFAYLCHRARFSKRHDPRINGAALTFFARPVLFSLAKALRFYPTSEGRLLIMHVTAARDERQRGVSTFIQAGKTLLESAVLLISPSRSIEVEFKRCLLLRRALLL